MPQQTPPPYVNITGISRADMKDNAQETIANYDGNARPGELVVDLTVDPPTVYVGNNLGQLTQVGSGGSGNGTAGGPTNSVQFNAGSGAFSGNANLTFANGNLNVGGDIVPLANNVSSLGSATQQFKDVWVSNATIYLNSIPLGLDSANELTFNGAPIVVSSNTATPQTANISTTASIIAGDYFYANGSPLVGAQGLTGAQGTTGSTGTQGATGNDGAQGANGTVGAQGTTGSTGTQGTTGDVGAQGTTGSTGAQGADGSTGVQGAIGVDGPQGTTGSTGTQGTTGSTGTQGTTGDTGTQGTTGTQGGTGSATTIIGSAALTTGNEQAELNAAFPSATNGDGVIDSNTGDLWVLASGTWNNVGNIVGPQGATGATGAQGTDGSTGLQGTTGNTGAQGTDGATGTQGATGSTGTQGATGDTGAQGTDGVTGTQGATGSTGTQGTTGDVGAQGTTGQDGAQGATGSTGLQGTTGNDGAQGTDGATGAQGTTGADGAQGTTGAQGATGAAANTGDITFVNSTISAPNTSTIILEALDNDGIVGSSLTLNPDSTLTRLEQWSPQDSNSWTTTDWATGVYTTEGSGTVGAVQFTGASAIIDFINTLDGIGHIFFSVNGGPLLVYDGASSGATNITFYTPTLPDTDPTTVTSFEYFYSYKSGFAIDYDQPEFLIYANSADLIAETTGGYNIELNSSQDLSLIANGTYSLTNFGNTEGVYITTDASAGVYQWNFDNTGNLTAPGIIQGSSTSGYALKLGSNPDETTAGRWLQVRSGDVADHIHFDTSNNSAWNFYLGSDNQYVLLSNTGNVSIGSYDSANAVNHNWAFDNSGVLTLPGEGVVRSNNDTITLESWDTANSLGYGMYVGTTGGLYFKQGTNPVWLNINPNASNVEISAGISTGGEAGHNISITAGAADQSDFYATPGGNINIVGGLGAFNDGGGGGAGGSVNITAGNSSDPAGVSGNITVNSGTNTWAFANNGNLTLPTNTANINYANGVSILDGIGGGTPTAISNGNSNVSISAAGGNISFTVGNSSAGIIGTTTLALGVGAAVGAVAQSDYALAIGLGAGANAQGAAGIAIGSGAGQDTQGFAGLAVGISSGSFNQGANAVALGTFAGGLNQGQYAVAIGFQAGLNDQGANSIVIGTNAGNTASANNSIIISASGNDISSDNSGLYVDPVRNDNGNVSNAVFFNTATKEVTYATTTASTIAAANTKVTLNNITAQVGGSPTRLYIGAATSNLQVAGQSQTMTSGAMAVSSWINVPISTGVGNEFAMSGALSQNGDTAVLNITDQSAGTGTWRISALIANTVANLYSVTIERIA